MTKAGSILISCVVFVLVGCGSGDGDGGGSDEPLFPPEQKCGLRVELAGDTTLLRLKGEPETTCMGIHRPGEIAVTYIPDDTSVLRELTVFVWEEIGVTGKGFRGDVGLDAGAGPSTSSGCSFDFLESRLVGTNERADQYRVVGVGRCTAPASANPGYTHLELIEIGRLEFLVSEWECCKAM